VTIIDVAAAADPSPDVARDLYDEALRSAWRSVGARLLVAAVLVPIVIVLAAADRRFRIAMGGSVFALLLWAGSSVRDLVRLLRSSPLESFQRDRQEEIELARHRTEHAVRLAGLEAWDTYRLAGSLVLVFAIEIWTGSIAAVVARAGLVKSAIVAGEWWRIVSASFLHANLDHLLANVGALLALGGLIEAYDRRLRLPLVYLVSVLGGSVASLALTDKSGIGASGGVVGLAGYLLILAHQRRVPGWIRSSMLLILSGTAFVGAVNYEFIGNAAHAGGALTGAAIALLTGSDRSRADEPLLDVLGWGAIATLAIAGVFTVSRLVMAP
jgi:membrane associated rhomboid family serine protease